MLVKQVGGLALEVDLSGAYAPDAGIELPLTQRMDVSYPPGSDRPIIHMQGIQDEPFTIRGVLCDAYHGSEVGGAHFRAVTLERMARGGYPVRVTWQPEDGDERVIDRECMIQDFSISWEKGIAGPIPWSLRLVPTDSRTVRPGQTPVRREDAAQTVEGDVAAMLAEAIAVRAASLAAATSGFARALAGAA